ncbi:MAG TPA: peptidoglycan-binding protein [Candidatus Paceibacterota bacterium]|nr:peptidoglycan-binding protein [Candidatus Paceibacterota bacterium]
MTELDTIEGIGFLPVSQETTTLFGPITIIAVKAFQKTRGIFQVGYVGSATRAALNR